MASPLKIETSPNVIGKRSSPEGTQPTNDENKDITSNQIFSPSKVNLGLSTIKSMITSWGANQATPSSNVLSPSLKKYKKEAEDKKETPSVSFITSSPLRSVRQTPLLSPVKRNLTQQFETTSTTEKSSPTVEEEARSAKDSSTSLTSKTTTTINALYNTLFSPRHVLTSLFGMKQTEEEITTTQTEISHGVLTTKTTSITLQTDETIVETISLEEENIESQTEKDLAQTEVTCESSKTVNVTVEDEGDEEDGEEGSEEIDEFDPLVFIAKLPELEEHHKNRPPKLPKKEHHEPKYTLVLDLDETLVHCSTEEMDFHDLKFPVWFNGISYQVFVKKRPQLHEFLERVSQRFEVVVFTASQEVYACKLLNLLDPDQKWIK